jgi:hypothetical protein
MRSARARPELVASALETLRAHRDFPEAFLAQNGTPVSVDKNIDP